jgi:predicted N-formylglutamate amidohydrolase
MAMDGCTANSDNYSLVITCEHGGNRIPIRYTDLFKANPVLLNTHRGFDPGALSMAKDLAAAFAAPLVASTISRLLVDLNRSVGHPHLHYEVLKTSHQRSVRLS